MLHGRPFTRRNLFIKIFSLPLLLSVGCGGEPGKQEPYVPQSCDDYSGLAPADLDLRKGFGYVDKSPIAESKCKNCNLFRPPGAQEVCGGCTLFKGPVYEEGYCTYWAPQV